MKEVVITSSILITALLLLRFVFATKVRRTLIYGAWILVALRLLIPVQIGHLPFSVLNAFQPVTQSVSTTLDKQVAGVTEQDAYQKIMEDYIEKDPSVFTPAVQEHIQSALEDRMPVGEIADMIGNTYPEQDLYMPEIKPQVQQQIADTAEPITLGQIATVVWLVGMVIAAVWLATGNWLLVRKLHQSAKPIPLDSPIPVYTSEYAISPCLAGLLHPAVYLPPECADKADITPYVMAHELTHYAHRDHLWAVIRCICMCLYWFHPLVWVAAWCCRRDCELACDEGALRRLGESQRIAYGKALLQVVRDTSVPGRLMLTATTMAETKKQLLRRVNFIAHKPCLSLKAALCMVLVCCLITGCVATGPKRPSAPPGTTAPTTPSIPEFLYPSTPSSGLKYTVNGDNFSCTVTGPGTCTDTFIMIPETIDGYRVTAIGSEAFKDCSTLEYAVIPDSVTQLGNRIFVNCTGLIAAILPKDISTIPVGMFNKCASLTNITIPENVVFISNGAFSGCTSLRSVTIPKNVKTLDLWAFSGCTSLKQVYLPEGLGLIEDMAFSGCSALEEIVIPDTVASIGSSAFKGCRALTKLSLGKNLSSIGTDAFGNCGPLEEITVSPENTTFRGAGNCLIEISTKTLLLAANRCVIPNDGSVTVIHQASFAGQTHLQELVIPEGIKTIPADVFDSCNSLTKITLPKSLETLGGNLDNCHALKTIFYNGTMKQWNALKKPDTWAYKVLVRCTDGDLYTR